MNETDVKRLVQELVENYGIDEALKIAQATAKMIEDLLKSTKPSIRYGPNPACIKVLVSSMSGGKILDLDDAWRILNSKLGLKDKKRNYSLSLLDWNKSLFQRVSEERGDRRWRLTPYGEGLAKHLSSSTSLTSVEKTLFSGLYLNEPITLSIYNFFKGQNRSRRQGIQFLEKQADRLQITPKQADWYIGEKTSALVALDLLTRTRGKETVYT